MNWPSKTWHQPGTRPDLEEAVEGDGPGAFLFLLVFPLDRQHLWLIILAHSSRRGLFIDGIDIRSKIPRF